MTSEAAEAAALRAYPGGEVSPRSATAALRAAYADGYDAGSSTAHSDAGWAANTDRQGGA